MPTSSRSCSSVQLTMNSEIVCQVLEVLEDLLLVSYRTNNKVFQGVLLDATRRLVVFQGVLLDATRRLVIFQGVLLDATRRLVIFQGVLLDATCR